MRLWTSIMQVCSSGEWDITEELFLQPVADLCGHRLDAIIDEAQHSYLKAPLRMDACMRLAHLYSEMRQVGFSVTGGEAPIVYRDCGPQLLVLLLERLPPEAFLHAVSECEDLRLDLLWAFFNEADACSQPAEPCCWVRPHPAINPGTRGSRGYNAAMRHKFMSIALFIMNCSRVESRYDTSKVRFCAYFTTCAWAQHSVTFDGLRADAAMLLALDGMMMRQPAAIMSTLLQRGFNADANVDLIASQCTAEILRSLIRLKTRPTHGPGSQLLDDILDVLDFPHLVKLADSSFAPCCSVTLQPVHVADYSLYDTYSGPRLHASVRASSEPFLVDVYLTRVQSRFNQDWNEFIIDKDVALTGSKTPHLQVLVWYFTPDASFHGTGCELAEEARQVVRQRIRQHVPDFNPPAPCHKRSCPSPSAFPYLQPAQDPLMSSFRACVKTWTPQASLEERKYYRTKRTILPAYIDYLRHDLHLDPAVLRKAEDYLRDKVTRQEWHAAVQTAHTQMLMAFKSDV